MSRRTDDQRATAIARAENGMRRMFPKFGLRIGIEEARAVAAKLGIDVQVSVGKTGRKWWGYYHPDDGVVLRKAVPVHVVLHELAHVVLDQKGVRCTHHGLRFLDAYIDLVWAYFQDVSMSRTFEPLLSVAR
jgi:hypothetical protein